MILKFNSKILLNTESGIVNEERKIALSKYAIAGYTNAGKSTLFNRLTEATSFEENQLFATLGSDD